MTFGLEDGCLAPVYYIVEELSTTLEHSDDGTRYCFELLEGRSRRTDSVLRDFWDPFDISDREWNSYQPTGFKGYCLKEKTEISREVPRWKTH